MKLTDASPMPYGKHAGKRMDEVPARYLIWLYDNALDRRAEPDRPSHAVAEYVHANLKALEQEAEKEAIEERAD